MNLIFRIFLFILSFYLSGCTLFAEVKDLSSNAKKNPSQTGGSGGSGSSGTPIGPMGVTQLKKISSNKTGTFNGIFGPSIFKIGSDLYFTKNDALYGIELWKKSETSPAGLLKDINPGTADSMPSQFYNLSGKLIFAACDGTNGMELWSSDGTAGGTMLLTDMDTDADCSYWNPFVKTVEHAGKLYFRSALNLWVTDGTPGGTLLIRSDLTIENLYGVIGTEVFFAASDATYGKEIYATQGTDGTTRLTRDYNVGSGDGVADIFSKGEIANGHLHFIGNNGTGGNKWASIDSGTLTVENTNAPTYFTPVGTKIFARVGNSAYESSGAGAWNIGAFTTPIYWSLLQTAGTNFFFVNSANDIKVYNGATISGSYTIGASDSNNNLFSMPLGNGMVFSDYNAINGWELFYHNGTTVTSLGDLAPGSDDSVRFEWNPGIEMGGFLFYTGYDPISGYELWKTNGTPIGTVRVKDIFPGFGGSDPKNLYSDGSYIYFHADDGTNGMQLWQSDGSEANTKIVENFSSPALGSNPYSFYLFNNELFFISNDQVHGEELWKTDGTTEGTQLVKDLLPSNKSAGIWNFVSTATHFAFIGYGEDNWQILFTSDGTESGTGVISKASGTFGFQSEPFVMNGEIYYVRRDSSYGQEFFKSNGTIGNFSLVEDYIPGSSSSFDYSLPEYLVDGLTLVFTNERDDSYSNRPWLTDGTNGGGVKLSNNISSFGDYQKIGGNIIFTGEDDANVYNRELFVSDGSPMSSMILKDINVGSASFPQSYIKAIGKYFFTADDGTSGRELWVTDGTNLGTILLKDIEVGGGSPVFGPVIEEGTYILFLTTNADGEKLWRSDGTALGTTLVRDWGSGSDGGTQILLGPGGLFYFAIDDGIHGWELWKSDGTPSGTAIIKDIVAGTGSSSPSISLNHNGFLFFNADDGVHGDELWMTDGTELNTQLVADVNTGSASSSPGEVAAVGTSIVYTADNGVDGRELYFFTAP